MFFQASGKWNLVHSIVSKRKVLHSDAVTLGKLNNPLQHNMCDVYGLGRICKRKALAYTHRNSSCYAYLLPS